jgi:aspartate-semialdehyde dehydrogenase
MSISTPSTVGIVGATGLVGELLLELLAERRFPLRSLRLFASARSAGKQIRWQDRALTVPATKARPSPPFPVVRPCRSSTSVSLREIAATNISHVAR